METKIEMYKNRSIGERFSAAGDFVRQNWKVLLKNIGYIGTPLALLMAYFFQNCMQSAWNPSDPLNFNLMSYVGVLICSLLLSLFMFSMTGAILNRYLKSSLTETTDWTDLKDNVFSFAGKMLVQGLILIVGFVIVSIVIALIIAGLMQIGTITGGAIPMMISFVVLLLVYPILIAIAPPLSLMFYPVFFENASPWQGAKKGFRLGFRYWGSTFLSILVGGLATMGVFYVLSMPYLLYTVYNTFDGGFVGYVLSMLMFLVMLVVQPVYIIFLAFQYTSIVEREEGVSLKDKIQEFDNL